VIRALEFFGKPKASASTQADGATEGSSDPYADTPLLHNHILAHHIQSEKRAWKVAFGIGIGAVVAIVALSLLLWNVYLTGGNHVFALTLDKDGVPLAPPRPVNVVADPTDAAIANRLVDCTKAAFWASPDNVINHANVNFAYSCVTGDAHAYLDTYYASKIVIVPGQQPVPQSPFERGKFETIEVDPGRIEKLSAQSYRVTWTAVARNFAGRITSTTPHGATFMLGRITGDRTEADVVANPFGIIITKIAPDTMVAQ
jgi:type IV secretory pathway TrbF-like protein